MATGWLALVPRWLQAGPGSEEAAGWSWFWGDKWGQQAGPSSKEATGWPWFWGSNRLALVLKRWQAGPGSEESIGCPGLRKFSRFLLKWLGTYQALPWSDIDYLASEAWKNWSSFEIPDTSSTATSLSSNWMCRKVMSKEQHLKLV